ncbi:MAG TPA: hypothetical protein VD997_06635 [Phycisphaerales bacterium]|nr:hypothetical protein [Phycisphaerales bacterium]
MANDQPKQSSPFVRMFIPGLVVGLICGGLAGAILPPILERYAGTPSAPVTGGAQARPAGPRDTVPGERTQPSAQPPAEKTPVDPVKEEPKPQGEQPTPPAETPTSPSTAPAPK